MENGHGRKPSGVRRSAETQADDPVDDVGRAGRGFRVRCLPTSRLRVSTCFLRIGCFRIGLMHNWTTQMLYKFQGIA